MEYKVILISANNNGAGKSTFANAIKEYEKVMMAPWIVYKKSLAEAVKLQLSKTWRNCEDAQKESFKTKMLGHETGREIMIKFAEGLTEKDPLYWCKKWKKAFHKFRDNQENLDKQYVIIIEDIRKTEELLYFKAIFSTQHITHFHLKSEYGEHDKNFPATKNKGILEQMADVVIDVRKNND